MKIKEKLVYGKKESERKIESVRAFIRMESLE